MLTNLEIEILEFAKYNNFHASIIDFVASHEYTKDEVLDSIKSLKKRRIIAVGSDIENDWIGVTNYGWKLMGWK